MFQLRVSGFKPQDEPSRLEGPAENSLLAKTSNRQPVTAILLAISRPVTGLLGRLYQPSLSR